MCVFVYAKISSTTQVYVCVSRCLDKEWSEATNTPRAMNIFQLRSPCCRLCCCYCSCCCCYCFNRQLHFLHSSKFPGVASSYGHNDYFEDYCPVLFPVCALLMFIGNVNICSLAIVYLPCYTHTSERTHTHVAYSRLHTHTHSHLVLLRLDFWACGPKVLKPCFVAACVQQQQQQQLFLDLT